MSKKNPFNIFLAVAGFILVWIPILAPVYYSIVRFIKTDLFLFDYLMAAEFGLLAFVGGVLLLWLSFRIRVYQNVVAACLVTMLLTLVGGMALASATSMAAGSIDRAGWRWTLVSLSLVLYGLALIILAICAIFLVKEVLR